MFILNVNLTSLAKLKKAVYERNFIIKGLFEKGEEQWILRFLAGIC